MLTSEKKVKLAALADVLAQFRKAEVLAASGLSAEMVDNLAEHLHDLSMSSGLKIEVICTPEAAHKEFRSTTVRVLKDNLCVHSTTLVGSRGA